MSHYIDGFVFPIASNRVHEYLPVAKAVAAIYREHGAIEYLEFVADDMHREGTCPFPDTINATPDETVVFGWIVFESRESRDNINQLIEKDPRIAKLVAPLIDSADPLFDPSRMAYGGFQPLVDAV